MAKKQQPMRKMSIADAVSEAHGELQGLAEEMRSWADNLEEKFSSTDKYARVSEAADTLEGFEEPQCPEWASTVEVEFMDLPPKRRGYSRADRCGQACYILDQCIQECQEMAEKTGEDEAASTKRDEAEQLADNLENMKSEAEGVEFPGMYG
jgi:hypothetical protein